MKILLPLFYIMSFSLVSCQKTARATQADFETIMNKVAEGWSTQNTNMALGSFDEDAIYMEPPNIQYYRGHQQLRPYFGELTPEHKMVFHHLWFDEGTQTGAGEFTFSYGKDIADTGMVMVQLENGKIKFWREYQKKGPANFEDYIAIQPKVWEWHIGNYPVPNDSLDTR